MTKLSASQRGKIEKAIAQHEKFKNSYFWTPPSNAGCRRAMERRESWSVSFTHNGKRYEYVSNVDCSCSNVYYKGFFYVDGERKTVRAFKSLISNR